MKKYLRRFFDWTDRVAGEPESASCLFAFLFFFSGFLFAMLCSKA